MKTNKGPKRSSLTHAIKNIKNNCVLKLLFVTTARPWCSGHFTSINACKVWRVRAGIQVFEVKINIIYKYNTNGQLVYLKSS